MLKVKDNKKVSLVTLGCKVNQYETQGLRELLLTAGYSESEQENSADICIINTCTVTHQADAASRNLIHKVLKANPSSRIIVTGCYVEKDAWQVQELSERIRILPNQNKQQICNFLNLTRYQRPATSDKTFFPLKISNFKDHQRAFIKVQDGCNNFCSFCKVPLVRPKPRSRKPGEIIAEARRLVDGGYKELVLTGICLGAYRYRDFELADVLAALARIRGEFRIRLSSIEPWLISDRLIGLLELPKVCAHLHIPLQSGDDTVLKKMNRRSSARDYLSLIARARRKIKHLALTTDVLVGFPGESQRNFGNTCLCLKEALPLRTHIFPFSPRPGTRAFSFSGRIEPAIIKERVSALREVAEECSYKFRRQFLGKTLCVLIESKPDRKSSLFSGYSENYIRLSVKDAKRQDVNRLLPVRVVAVENHSTLASRGRFRRMIHPTET